MCYTKSEVTELLKVKGSLCICFYSSNGNLSFILSWRLRTWNINGYPKSSRLPEEAKECQKQSENWKVVNHPATCAHSTRTLEEIINESYQTSTQEIDLFDWLEDQQEQEHQVHLKLAPLAATAATAQQSVCENWCQHNMEVNHVFVPYNMKNSNLSPDVEHRSLHWICTVPATLEPLHETFGRIAICTLSLSFLAASRFI